MGDGDQGRGGLERGTPLGSWLEHRTLDLRFRHRAPLPQPSPVTMEVLQGERIQQDERSLRQDLADLLETLATFSEPMRPRAGVIDVRLSTPSMPSEPGKPSGTQRVIRDTATLGRVVHAFDLATDFWEYQSPGASQQLKRHALALETPSSSSSSVTASPPGLATSSAPGFASQTAREALEEARTWAQTAEQERSELAERLERTLQRASMAESTAGRLQSDLSVARDPAEIIRLERVLDTAREEAETPRQEVRGLERRDHPPGRQRHAGRSGPHPAGCLRARVGPGDFLHRP